MRRRALASAFDAAAGPAPTVCTRCGGWPYTSLVYLAEEKAPELCGECFGPLDDEGRPVARSIGSPSPAAGPPKVIVLMDDELEEDD